MLKISNKYQKFRGLLVDVSENIEDFTNDDF